MKKDYKFFYCLLFLMLMPLQAHALDFSLPCKLIKALQDIALYAAVIAIAAWALERIFGKSSFGDIVVNVVIGLAVVIGAVGLIGQSSTVVSTCAGHMVTLSGLF